MAVTKITEAQFRTRRRDRRMVWVDGAAALVGLLLVTSSVAGVVVLEEDPEPFEWSTSVFEGKVTQKRCAGGDVQRVGCKYVHNGADSQRDAQPEMTLLQAGFDPVVSNNVTRVTFTLLWNDDTPEDADQRNYVYDDNSTDILRLRVVSPTGEEQLIEGANSVPQKEGEVPTGLLRLEYSYLPTPELGKVSAFTQAEVEADLAAQYTVEEHDALGDWQAFVTVVRSGDQNGTVPANICHNEANGQRYDVPQQAEDAFATGPASDYYYIYEEQTCDTEQNRESIEQGAPSDERYRSTYVDNSQEWVLEMVVWTYSTTVSL